jgi:hypothetical protein
MQEQTQDRITNALKSLEEGIQKLAESGEWKKFLEFQSAFHRYSFANTMLILTQRPDATRVAGFKTWKKLGRQVLKGQTALWIMAPVMARKPQDERKVKEVQEDPKDQENVSSGHQDGHTKVVSFRLVPVFDISQTSGPDLPSPIRKLSGDEGEELFDRLAGFAQSRGIDVVIRAIDDETSANGYYEPEKRKITVHISLSWSQKAKTLAHELGHSILHNDLEVYREHRGDCELEAESVAFVVLNHEGIHAGEYSFGYVATWKGGGEEAVKALKTSAQKIQFAAKQILEGISVQEQVEEVA